MSIIIKKKNQKIKNIDENFAHEKKSIKSLYRHNNILNA